MTRDELILKQLGDNARIYRVLFIVLVVAAIAAVALAVAMASQRDWGPCVYVLGMALGFAGSAVAMRSQSNAAANAVAEIGDNAKDLDQYHDFSPATMSALRTAQYTTKQYFGMIWAYGICGAMMVGLGLMMLFLLGNEEPVLSALAALLAFGGVLLCILTAKSYVNWRTSKQLDQIGPS